MMTVSQEDQDFTGPLNVVDMKSSLKSPEVSGIAETLGKCDDFEWH